MYVKRKMSRRVEWDGAQLRTGRGVNAALPHQATFPPLPRFGLTKSFFARENSRGNF